MILNKVKLSIFLTNCYILTDENSGKTVVIDPGKYNEKLIQELKRPEIGSIEAILLTHGHYDHIGGVKALKEYCGADIFIHAEDAPCLEDAELSLASQLRNSHFESVKADKLIGDGDVIVFGSAGLRVIHTPGHTPGSVCYLSESTADLFTGDTLFKLSVGRTDFPRGDWETLKNSLKKIAAFDKNYTVYPGHEDSSSLDFEKANNGFLRNI